MISFISWLQLVFYLDLELPTFIICEHQNHWRDKDTIQKRLGILKLVLHFCIITAMFVPIGIEGFGYAGFLLYGIHLLGFLIFLVAHWIVFAFVLKGTLHANSLEIVNALCFLLAGLMIGSRPLSECYWVMVILAVLLLLLTIVQLRYQPRQK